MALFAQICAGLSGFVALCLVAIYVSDRLQERKIIKRIRKERALQEAKDAPTLDALENPELIELGGPRKALPGDAVADPFRGVE